MNIKLIMTFCLLIAFLCYLFTTGFCVKACIKKFQQEIQREAPAWLGAGPSLKQKNTTAPGPISEKVLLYSLNQY